MVDADKSTVVHTANFLRTNNKHVVLSDVCNILVLLYTTLANEVQSAEAKSVLPHGSWHSIGAIKRILLLVALTLCPLIRSRREKMLLNTQWISALATMTRTHMVRSRAMSLILKWNFETNYTCCSFNALQSSMSSQPRQTAVRVSHNGVTFQLFAISEVNAWRHPSSDIISSRV